MSASNVSDTMDGAGPQMLFHYRPFDAAQLTQIVVGAKHYCSDPTQVVDFLSGSAWFNSARLDSPLEVERLANWIVSLEESSRAPMSAATRRHRVQQLQSSRSLLERTRDDIARATATSIAVQYRLLCLSELPDADVLWDRYAGRRSGLCLGFSRNNSLFKSARAISYVDQHIDLCVADDLRALEMRILLTKLSRWSHEKEHRVVVAAGGCRSPGLRPTVGNFVALPGGALKLLILGCGMAERERRQVRDILAQSPTPIEIRNSAL